MNTLDQIKTNVCNNQVTTITMASLAGKKRAATHNREPSTSSKHTSKKTRFVEPSDDPTAFAEQVDSALENTSRKGKVKNEGYESDSSDDGEGVVFSRRKDPGAGDDDDDMFAAAEKEESTTENETLKKKKDQYMRLGDIEGQEFGGDSGSESSDDVEDEDDAERRKKAGMGFELSSFNMREEMEEGKFTEDGSYVKSFDPHGVHDRWMEGLDDREIKLARRRKREQEKKQREKMEAEERELEQSGGKNTLEMQLLPLLKKGETVLDALQRLGRRKKSTHSAKGAISDAKPQDAPTDIERITHLASTLMSLGDTDIYSKSYEELVRGVRSSGSLDPSWEPPSADVKYEYKWDIPGSGSDTFGPFGEEELKAWYKASYFGPSGEKVKVRQAGGEWGDWDNVVQ